MVRLNVLAARLQHPDLQTDITRFLHSQIFPDGDFDADADLEDFPHISHRRKIAVHRSASVVFHAPSEACGERGMHREIIRCNSAWLKNIPRFDTVLVTTDIAVWGMPRFRVARIRQFLSVMHENVRYQGALVEWFVTDGDGADGVTGMWVVRPEVVDGARVRSVIPLSSIARACHLMPVYGPFRLPPSFNYRDTLDAFAAYYVNHYIDYHAHEVLV